MPTKATLGGVGALLVSVDCGSSDPSFNSRKTLDQRIRQLGTELARRELPAVWGISDPDLSPALESVLNQSTRHEVALLAPASGLESRREFARHLAPRVAAARQADLPLTTLVAPQPIDSSYFDLLVRNRIAAVRIPDQCRRSVRFGIWQTAPTVSCPSAGWWSDWRAVRVWRKSSLRHLVIDASGSWKPILSWLDRAAGEVQSGALRPTTLGRYAARLNRRDNLSSARSVLRAA